MKILALSDIESRSLWDYFDQSRLEGIDVILSCGDLDAHYLSFLATFFKGPVLYVHGNHDDSYDQRPPEGCVCIDGQLFVYHGVRFLGLGGSMRYKPGTYQYTQFQMDWRVWRLWLKICRNKGFDVLVSHAPAFEINDGDNLPHQGFKAFVRLMERFSPQVFVHGHIHLNYGGRSRRLDRYQDTVIINAYERYVFEVKEMI